MKKPACETALHVNDLFGDDDGDSLPGLVGFDDSSDDGLDMGVLFTGDDDLSDVDSDFGDSDRLLLNDETPPLLQVVTMMMQQMPSHFYGHLLETWKIFATLSDIEAFSVGSGCSGSGLDHDTIKKVDEVLVGKVYCQMCHMFVLILNAVPFFFVNTRCWPCSRVMASTSSVLYKLNLTPASGNGLQATVSRRSCSMMSRALPPARTSTT